MATTSTITGIDEAVNKHLLLVSELLTQRNSYLPIFRLPPETLASIFVHASARDYHETTGPHTFHVPHWVNVSYVCRHWREVALNSPALWSYHFTVSLRWTEELLVRSKQASLKVYIFSDSQRDEIWWSTLVESLLAHVERIQELRLRVPPVVIPPKFSLHAPRLQILEMEGPYKLASTLHDMHIPPLCILKLTECPLPWHPFNLSGLTTLFLCDIPRSSRHNIIDFLAILARIQALTSLHLERALLSARGLLSSNVLPEVGLPCLTRLLVHAPLSTVVALLTRVNIPLETDLRLEFRWEVGSSISDYTQILPLVAQRFQSKASSSFAPTIRSLSVCEIHTGFSLAASKDGGSYPKYPYASMEDPYWETNTPLVILVNTNSLIPASDRERIKGDICCALPLSGVKTLDVVFPSDSSDFWRRLLGCLPGLRCMTLSKGRMPDLASLLALTADEAVEAPRHITDPNPSSGHTFVPRLEELALGSIAFAGDSRDRQTISEKSLRDALSTRNAPRPQLIVYECETESD